MQALRFFKSAVCCDPLNAICCSIMQFNQRNGFQLLSNKTANCSKYTKYYTGIRNFQMQQQCAPDMIHLYYVHAL